MVLFSILILELLMSDSSWSRPSQDGDEPKEMLFATMVVVKCHEQDWYQNVNAALTSHNNPIVDINQIVISNSKHLIKWNICLIASATFTLKPNATCTLRHDKYQSMYIIIKTVGQKSRKHTLRQY